MKVLAFPRENAFQDSYLILRVIFTNTWKPTAPVSELPSPSALRRETVSGRDEAWLPRRSPPGLETEHTHLRMLGCRGVQNIDFRAPSRHLESAFRGGPGIELLNSSRQPGLLPLPLRPCPSLEGHGLSGHPGAPCNYPPLCHCLTALPGATSQRLDMHPKGSLSSL